MWRLGSNPSDGRHPMTRYVYSVLRFVPDPARGEQVNVGAIVGSSETGEWVLHEIDNKKRARALSSSTATISTFTDYVGRQIDASADDESEDSPWVDEDWLVDIARQHRNVIQLSPPAPVSADSLEQAVGYITERLLVDPLSTRLPYVGRSTARAKLRSAYRTAGLVFDENVFARVRLTVEDTVAENIDFAVANGKPRQLAQAWSFQTPDDEALVRRLRSWSWTIAKLRHSGGVVRLGEHRREHLDADVQLEAVVVPPHGDQGSQRVWTEALGTFGDLGIVTVGYERSGEVALQAAKLLVPA